MKAFTQTKSFLQRVCVLVVVVAPLCISDSAGPRLLPLGPAVESKLISLRADFATSAPSRDCTPNGHQELICGYPYRQRDRQDDAQTATAIAPTPNVTASECLSVRLFGDVRKAEAGFLSRPPDRGPPQLL